MSDKGTPEGSKVLFGTPTTSRQVGFQFTNPEFASALGFENQITTYWCMTTTCSTSTRSSRRSTAATARSRTLADSIRAGLMLRYIGRKVG